MDEREQTLLANAIRIPYLTTEAARLVLTDACVLTGHRPKIDKPFEMKQKHERGCACGRQPYA